MKITKIRFENIHSLKGEHEIDFAGGILGEAGLFAITGPTGSGKSTLLDIITLALYNRIARVDKDISNPVLEDEGGIMTRNMKSCYAEVEYISKGKEYRSHWSIERNRNNNLKNRKQELVEIATGTILESGTKTPQKNVEVIGLSYDQFVKAMVLSQGEFSKLLQASRKDRNKLLEDITGARSYREIGKAVYQRYNSLREQVKLKEAGLETLEVFSPEVIHAKNEELKLLIRSKPALEKAFQNAAEKINLRKELLKKLQEQQLLEKNKTILKDHMERFQEKKNKLDQHEKFSKYGPGVRDYNSLLKQVEEGKQYDSILQKKKEKQEIELKTLLDSSSSLLGEIVSASDANEKLEHFRRKITDLQAKENSKSSEALLFQKQLIGYGQNIEKLGYQFPQPKTPSEFESRLKNLEASISETIANCKASSLEELNSRLEKLRESYETALQFINLKQQYIKLEKELESQKIQFKAGKQSVEEDLEIIKSLEKEIFNLEKSVAEQSQILEHQKKHLSLDQHRAQLKPATPCPLCGSLEHPYAVEQPHFDVKEDLLKDNQKLLKIKSELEISHRQKVKFQNAANDRLIYEIEELKKETAEENHKLEKLSKILSWNHKDNLQELQSKRAQLNLKIQNLENSKLAFQALAVLRDLNNTFNQWELALNSYSNFKEERTKLYSGKNIDKETHNLSTQITQSLANISSLHAQLKENYIKLKAWEEEKTQKKKILDSIFAKEGLQDITHLESLILDEETAILYRKKDAQLKDGAARLSETEKRLTSEMNALLIKDDKNISMEILEETFAQTKKKWDELSINIGKITESLDKDSQTRARQQQFLEELNFLKKDRGLWKTMNDLIGDSMGNKFSNFVQDLTLEQLIGFANKRLLEFSDRYLLDIPTAEEAEKSDTLKIFDKYMGNARRSVKTLSGGETFLVSLAMAFALSDIASRNVKIESLFIDEGFGTLDPETLDQAITILEKMQNEGDRSVGIISHVSALKERITAQIKLEKSSLGYSTIEIVQ